MTALSNQPFEGVQLNVETFREQGMFILRGLFNQAEAEEIKSSWHNYYTGHLRAARVADLQRTINVTVDEHHTEQPATLNQMYRHPALVAVATQILGPDVAFYNNRMTMKDEFFRGSIGVHSDFPYNYGLGQKLSFFVPITNSSVANGSLYFMLKSHHLGYCGGIPKIDHAHFPEFPAICPELRVGDVVVCDYHLWHYSLPADFEGERVLFQIIYQPANDGSGKGKLVSGQWRTNVFFGQELFNKIWKDSKRNLEVNELTEAELAQIRQIAELEREIEKLSAENAELRRQSKSVD